MAGKTKTPSSPFVTEGNGYADITLSRPASIAGASTTVLRMREPIARDIESYQDSRETEGAREIAIFANLCEVTTDEIRNLPLRDYNRLQTAFALFTI